MGCRQKKACIAPSINHNHARSPETAPMHAIDLVWLVSGCIGAPAGGPIGT
jgi:hypothetical protein